MPTKSGRHVLVLAIVIASEPIGLVAWDNRLISDILCKSMGLVYGPGASHR